METQRKRGRSFTGAPTLILVIALIVLTVGLGYVFYLLYRDAELDRASTRMAAEVRSLSGDLAKSASLAALGDAEAAASMTGLRNGLSSIWNSVEGSIARELPAASVSSFAADWVEMQRQLDEVAARHEAIRNFRPAAARTSETIADIRSATANLGKTMVAAKAFAAEIDAAYSLTAWTEQMEAAATLLTDPDRRVADSFAQLGELNRRFALLLNGLRNGDAGLGLETPRNTEVRYQLAATADRYRAFETALGAVGQQVDDVIAAQAATDAIVAAGDRLAALADTLAEDIRALRTGDVIENVLGVSITGLAILGVGLLVLGLAAMGFILISDTRRRLRATAEANQANQDAILRLLDEIEGLAEGDLTAEAKVTQDFTGAIADAINYSIQQLRELVSRIQEASADVSAASGRTRAIALDLADAAEHQAREITNASSAISEMAITIDQVSANAAESAAVAERSVSIAGQGAGVVRETIAGMDRIREQIQDTAKRIKRLGESSQEIGDIVSLIGDIAEQTNILALNAAIQASMAGDAGRGFAVVADEVQRLAERSAGAARQVATLVAAIQTDTGAAVASMEQTTAEVVAGAGLTEDAGVSLNQIETVSADLAELIQDISTAARHQSSTAAHISGTMNVIQEIALRTRDQGRLTAASIGELTDMAIELRQSVSGFRLPETSRPRAERSAEATREPFDPGRAVETSPEQQSGTGPRPHIAAVLAESSALLDAIDQRRDLADAHQPPPSFGMSSGSSDDQPPPPSEPELASVATQGDDWVNTVASDLAEVDLDEFELDPDERRR